MTPTPDESFEKRVELKADQLTDYYDQNAALKMRCYSEGARFGRLEGWKEAVFELKKAGLMSGEIMAYTFLEARMPKERE